MSNPFRRRGQAAHTSDDWWADAGLSAQAKALYVEGEPGGYALIGSLGTGKSAALRAVASVREAAGVAVGMDYGPLSGGDLAERVLMRLIAERPQALDEAWGAARADARTLRPPDRDALFRLIREVCASRPCLIALDEVHVLERQAGEPLFAAADDLARLSEAVRGGRGALFVSLTPDAWDLLGPRVQSRFLPIESEPLTATDIRAVLVAGLARGDGAPQTCSDALVDALLARGLSMRDLHHTLYDAWARAHRAGAATVTEAHLP